MEPSRGSKKDKDADAGAVGGKCDTRGLLKVIDRLHEKNRIRSAGQQNIMKISAFEELGEDVSQAKRQKKQQDPGSGNLQQNRDKMDSKNIIPKDVSTAPIKVTDAANTKTETESDPRIVVEIRKPLYTIATVPINKCVFWNRPARTVIVCKPGPSNQCETVNGEKFKKRSDGPMNLVADTPEVKTNEGNTKKQSDEAFNKLDEELVPLDNEGLDEVVEFLDNDSNLSEEIDDYWD